MNEVFIECWSCHMQVTLAERSDEDGFCPHCMCELDLEGYLTQSVEAIDTLRAELAALKGGRADTDDIFWREKLAIKFCEARGINEGSKERASVVDAFVSALSFTAPPAQASAWVPEGWKLVPVEPTEEMWGGLARDLMMWFDFGNPTVEALRKHLSMLKIEWPAWMDSESEMQGSGVPSKGTRATLIYKAMLSAAPIPGASDGSGGES